MDKLSEQPLTGGLATAGVVRLGQTVRRPRKPNGPLVQALLRHLQNVGCEIAPRHLGVDQRGRDVLSYIEGDTEPSLRDYGDEAVRAAARLLRQLHDATRNTPLAAEQEAVCHFDCGPYKAIFRNGAPVAWIDFDMAWPGRVIDDLAYLIWMWCLSLQSRRASLDVQCRQAALAAASYGIDLPMRSHLVEAVIGRIDANITYWTGAIADSTRVTVSADRAKAMLHWSHAERAHVMQHRSAIEQALMA